MSFALPTPINGPIQSPSQDQLSRLDFAERISRQLRNMTVSDGFVYAITGTWGSGKSSILNLTKYYLLGSDYNSTANFRENTPQVIDFNPWWFESNRDLVSEFVKQLSLEISVRATTLDRLRPVAEATRRIAAVLKHIPVPVPYWQAAAEAAGELATQVARPPEKPVSVALSELRSALAELKPEEKLIVFCDDLDRLDAAEVVSMFGVMKAIAALPNLVFVTAFDRSQVAQCLKGQIDDPSRYLEKIIQLEIALPSADASDYDKWFRTVSHNLAKQSSPALFDQERFDELCEIAQVLIRSPRDMTRFENRLVGSFDSVRSEVNIVDYLGLHLLTAIVPEVAVRIQREKVLLVDDAARAVESIRSRPNGDSVIENRLKYLTSPGLGDVTTACDDLLGLLFPYFEMTVRRDKVKPHRLKFEDQLHRICDLASFDVYFSLEIPETRLRDEAFQATWSLRNDPNAFSQAIVTLGQRDRRVGSDHAKQFIRRMTCELRSLQPEQTNRLLRTVLTLPDDWWAPTPVPVIDSAFDRPDYLRYLETSLARIGAPGEAVQFLESAIPEVEGLSVLARWLLNQTVDLRFFTSELSKTDRQTATNWIQKLTALLGDRASSLLSSDPSKLLRFADPTHVMHFAFRSDPELASSGLFGKFCGDRAGFLRVVESAIDFENDGPRFNLDRLKALTGLDLPNLIERIDRIAPGLQTRSTDAYDAMLGNLRGYIEKVKQGADSESAVAEFSSPTPDSTEESAAANDKQEQP